MGLTESKPEENELRHGSRSTELMEENEVRKSLNRSVVVAATLALALVVLAGCGSDSDSSGTTATSSNASSDAGAETLGSVDMIFYPGFGTLPLYIGVSNGFFEKQGLEVKPTEGTDSPAMLAGLGKQFDIAMTAPGLLLNAANQGLSVEAISNLQLTGPEWVNSPFVASRPIKSIKEYEGETVGVLTIAGTMYNAVEYLLEEAGGSPDNVNFVVVPPPDVADQVKSGRVLGAYSAVPFYTGLEEEGLWIGDNDVLAEAVTVETDGAQTTTSAALMAVAGGYADENPEIVRAFRAGLAEAIEFIRNEPVKARAILKDWLGVPKEVAEEAPLPGMAVDISAEVLDPWVAILTQVGALEGEAPDTKSLMWSGSDEGV